MKRLTRAIAAFALLAGTSAAHAADGEFGVLMKTLSNPFWGAMSLGVEDGAKEANVPYFLQAAESDRILLNGLIQPFQQPERVVGFFNTYRELYPVSNAVLRDIATRT